MCIVDTSKLTKHIKNLYRTTNKNNVDNNNTNNYKHISSAKATIPYTQHNALNRQHEYRNDRIHTLSLHVVSQRYHQAIRFLKPRKITTSSRHKHTAMCVRVFKLIKFSHMHTRICLGIVKCPRLRGCVSMIRKCMLFMLTCMSLWWWL